MVQDGVDPEGFSAGSAQFDSDITDGRHPRAALGVADGIALSVTCDGRSAADAGLTLGELAELMAALGAQQAINLDGGGLRDAGLRRPDRQLARASWTGAKSRAGGRSTRR